MNADQAIAVEIANIRKLLASIKSADYTAYLKDLENVDVDLALELMFAWRRLLDDILAKSGDQAVATQILRKYDAGRRSPPWQEGSVKKAGARRPQDGDDGNRRSRWLFEKTHEFYATKTMACLVELKFVLQTFSMVNGPSFPNDCTDLQTNPLLVKIVGHKIEPGRFVDPLTQECPDFNKFKADRRYLEAGHIKPHGRRGRHTCENATLAYRVSNRMQSDLTIDETLENMAKMLRNNGYSVTR